jgi:hypothetical protein
MADSETPLSGGKEGHGDVWQADAGYITQREGQWHQALLG